MTQATPSPISLFFSRLTRAVLTFGTAAAVHAQSVTFTTLAELSGTGGGNAGKYPSSPLCPASDGNFYGTTLKGGASDFGTLFKLTPGGVYSVLRTFTGALTPTPGYFPAPGLVQDGTGALIGMTSGDVTSGGGNSIGTIFSTPLSGATFQTHATFTGLAGVVKGAAPVGSLIKHANGWFYGTAEQGGSGNHGVLFKFKPKTLAPYAEYTVLVEFTNNGAANKGRYPNAALLDGGNGYLYGTTYAGGTSDFGTLFKFRISDETLTTIASFTGTSSPVPGKYPVSQLCRASSGLIYGTTPNGGGTNAGVIFRLDPSSDTLSAVVEFTDKTGSFQGAGPFAGLVEGNDGNLYGTTQYGGAGDHGTIFRLTPAGSFTPKLIEFTGTAGSFKGRRPNAAMVKGTDGALYGSTLEGGLNSNTTGFGTLFKLTTGTQPAPLATTGGATNVTGSSATLNGTVNPKGESSAWQFEFGTTTAYGTLVPVTAGTTGSGNAVEAVTADLTGLTSGATYHYRLRASNSGGTVYGDDATFTASVSPQVPVAVTGTATGITSDAATLNGTVNPRGSITAWQFEYGTTTDYGSAVPLTPGTLSAGSAAVAVSVTLTGLPPGTTVYYRLKATNGAGSAGGDGGSFTTGGALQGPAVITGTASHLTDTSATLNGTVNPRGSATAWQFEYGPTPAFGFSLPVPAATLNGLTAQPVSVTLSGLPPGTLTYFRLKGSSAASAGPVIGSIGSFTTLPPPEVVTLPAIGISKTEATLLGSVNPREAPVTWQFEYGPTAAYGQTAPLTPGSTSGSNTAELVSLTLSGLSPGSTWYYRVKATNSAGTGYFGDGLSFTTPQPPEAVTGAAFNITATGVTLQGTVNPHGIATSWQFEYGTAGYGFSIPLLPGVTGSGRDPEVVSAALTSLLPNTTYHFRLRASNSNGTETGSEATFTTAANIASWRQTYFGTLSDTGAAANHADPDADGVVNLLEYGFGMNPTVQDASLRPVPAFDGSVLIASFTQPPGVNDVTYAADVSTNLIHWSPIADGGSGRAHLFAGPASSAGRDFMRLKVILIP